ncbi:hypothetical protein [Methanococcus maripaludis]|jgi:hypothetical protein|uniref:Uncharacterized protein n=5 Tax=Methanococcus maripaludis TaxID=39152 RepID=Q6LWV2_METMP|nr:hypothetical protein [Methanococcus maripaludis]AEK20626.1 hypothetical protein GYY_08865 [Methanococcus maripaludis X1]MBA2847502.1 hypothetical protein [Methanococcus maripaludis]MBA2857424.1 hypothetical protein [Methanococcus maripaludis]MBB6067357.1 hypothetical protein [Methanococcus maripaludis]MBG0769200.1 hypothetical protein [Methanococcus maripaludis]
MLNFEIIRKNEIIANGNYMDEFEPNGKLFVIPHSLEEGLKLTAFLSEITKKIQKMKSKNELYSNITVGEYSLRFE